MDSLTYKQYPFLKELGIKEDNKGCYRNGEWVGNGKVITSFNPANGKPIARVQLASLADYHDTMKYMETEKERWAKMPPPQRGEIIR